jgi:LysM repeat protein
MVPHVNADTRRQLMHRVVFALVLVIVALLFTASAAAPVHAQMPPPQPWPILGYHTVRPYETLFCIGRGYGVDPWAIARTNGIVNVNYLWPGQVLAIPNAPAWLPPGPTCPRQDVVVQPQQCTCTTIHYVQPGQSLYGIGAMYHVSPASIATCNNVWNWNLIYAYQSLCIPAQ